MNETAQHFIERMGLMAEAEGFPRTAGRILGLLLLCEEPYSLDQLAEELQVSKASVSTNARLLEQTGLVERSTSPGDRRDFYRLGDDPWRRMFALARRRMQRMHDVLSDGCESLPTEMTVARRRIREWQRFYAFLLADFESRADRWSPGTTTESAA